MDKFVTVEITKLDDKKETFECIDTPMFSEGFCTLYFPNLERKMIRTETILEVNWTYSNRVPVA